MHLTSVLTKLVCGGPFSFALGSFMGLVLLYVLHKAKEGQQMQKAFQEIEAMVKALEIKTKTERVEGQPPQ